MIIKLSERYRYDREKKDLKTCFISLSDIEYFEIDLFKEVIELENNQQFMKIWKEEGSKEHCKYKYCLSNHLWAAFLISAKARPRSWGTACALPG